MSSAQSVPIRFSFESPEDMNAYIRDELRRPGVSIYFDEDIGNAIEQAESVVQQGAVHEAVNEGSAEYNPDGTYAHRGHKEKYQPFDDSVGEGLSVQNMFIAIHLATLKRNYSFEKKENPLFPPNYNVKLPSVYGKGYEKVTVSAEFFRYAIKEYENHQRKRIWEGEERSNCFKKGAHKDWTNADRNSLLINAVKLPPKPDIPYRPSLGSN